MRRLSHAPYHFAFLDDGSSVRCPLEPASAIPKWQTSAGQCRVSQLKAMVRAIESLTPTQRYAVLDRVGTPTLAAIEGAPAAGWLPVSLNFVLANAVYELAGPQATRDWSRRLSVETFATGLMRAMVKGMQAILELSPKTWFKRVPGGWNAVYRDGGEVVVEVDPVDERVVLKFINTPVGMRSDAFMTSMAGGFDAVLELTGAKGRAIPTLRGEVIEMEITWMARK